MQGLAEGFAPGAVHVDMSTIAPASARALAERYATRGVGWVDAQWRIGDRGTRTDSFVLGYQSRSESFQLYVRYHGVIPESSTKFEDFLVDSGRMKKVACGDNFISSIAEPVAYEAIADKLRADANYFLAAPAPATRDPRFEVRGEMVAL